MEGGGRFERETVGTKDRRRHDRRAAALGCKVMRAARARFLSAETADVSAGGALIEIRTATPVQLGESLDVAIAWDRGGLVRTRDLVAARAVRVTPLIGQRQRVAVRFEAEQAGAQGIEVSPAGRGRQRAVAA